MEGKGGRKGREMREMLRTERGQGKGDTKGETNCGEEMREGDERSGRARVKDGEKLE